MPWRSQPGLIVDLHLGDPVDLVLDRVLTVTTDFSLVMTSLRVP